MKIETQRLVDDRHVTLSTVHVNGRFYCFWLEPSGNPEYTNWPMRIPAGEYSVVARTHGGVFNRMHKKYGYTFVPEIEDVPGRTNILIHIGNTHADTKGCPLPGTEPRFPRHAPMWVARSHDAMLPLYRSLKVAYAARDNVTLIIRDEGDDL